MLEIEHPDLDIKLTEVKNLDEICQIELDDYNKPYITIYSFERHKKYVDDDDILHLTVYHKKKKYLVGYIIIVGIKNPDHSLELRKILINEKGKGYGKACLKAVMKYCFDVLRFHRLWLDVYEGNERAKDIYLKMNFTIEGKLREVAYKDDRYQSMYIMSLLEREYRTQNA